MPEAWKHPVDNYQIFRNLLTYMSTTFNCISHDVLIAKFNHGLSVSSLKLMHNYRLNLKQQTKTIQSIAFEEKYVCMFKMEPKSMGNQTLNLGAPKSLDCFFPIYFQVTF